MDSEKPSSHKKKNPFKRAKPKATLSDPKTSHPADLPLEEVEKPFEQEPGFFRGEWRDEKEIKAINYLKNLSDEVTHISENMTSFTMDVEIPVIDKSSHESAIKRQEVTPSPRPVLRRKSSPERIKIPERSLVKTTPLKQREPKEKKEPRPQSIVVIKKPIKIKQERLQKMPNPERTPSPCSKHDKEKAQVIESHHPTFFELSNVYYFRPTLSRGSKRHVTLEGEAEKIKEKEKEEMELHLKGMPLTQRERETNEPTDAPVNSSRTSRATTPFLKRSPSFTEVNTLIQQVRMNALLLEREQYSASRASPRDIGNKILEHPVQTKTFDVYKKPPKLPQLREFPFFQIEQRRTSIGVVDKTKTTNDWKIQNKVHQEFPVKIIGIKKKSNSFKRLTVRDLTHVLSARNESILMAAAHDSGIHLEAIGHATKNSSFGSPMKYSSTLDRTETLSTQTNAPKEKKETQSPVKRDKLPNAASRIRAQEEVRLRTSHTNRPNVRYSLTMKPEIASIINNSSAMDVKEYLKPNNQRLSSRIGQRLKAKNKSPDIKVAIAGNNNKGYSEGLKQRSKSVINYNMGILRPAWFRLDI